MNHSNVLKEAFNIVINDINGFADTVLKNELGYTSAQLSLAARLQLACSLYRAEKLIEEKE